MHIIIGGYGRVGRSLAHELEARGHTVAIMDHDPAAFEEFDEIRGRKIAGEVFDRETLERAGIAKADCVCAVTSGDNSNFICARVARERYGVKTVIARIYEPRRAYLYRNVGIATISSVEWAMTQFLTSIPGVDDTALAAHPTEYTTSMKAIFVGEGASNATPTDLSHIVIVGGGKSGAYLAARLRATHRVTLIEARASKIEALRNRMPDIEVLHGDGCEPHVLERAGVSGTGLVAAATGDDEDNLVVAHLVKNIDDRVAVVARINHPANEWLFTPDWGVDVPVGAAAGLYNAVAERFDSPTD